MKIFNLELTALDIFDDPVSFLAGSTLCVLRLIKIDKQFMLANC